MSKEIKIIRSSIIGYCMGVKKAVESAINAKKIYPYSNIYTFGQLIHNPTTLKMLENLNIQAIDEKDLGSNKIKAGDVVVIRAHGVSPEIIDKLKEKNINIINSTCPRVIKNRKLAERYAENSLIILAGDKNHPELIGIQGYVLNKKNAKCIIVQNAEEASNVIIYENELPIALIPQTTIKEEEFILISNILKKKIKNLIIFNTICSATRERQDALKALFNKVEAILIIGGKNSANTKRLFNTAKISKTPSFFIEDEKDLPNEISSFNTIGLASGASTPDEVIDQVEKAIHLLKNI
ncbi:MAG: 4-hydroxy-3-methylbut-2-enyl diphosphate reductase [Treponema sp.]